MLFSSIHFLFFFLVAVTAVHFAVPSRMIRLRNAVLFFFSLAFYAWGEKQLVVLFALSVFAGYILGLLIERNRGKTASKVFLALSIIFNLGMLCYFKYTDFFIGSLNSAFRLAIPAANIALPIGISFYTFQLMSYDIDVYRGNISANRSFVDFGTYVSFFPQLIAGPIVRYSDIEAQLKKRSHSPDKAAEGVRRFTIGLSKKVFIANLLGELVAQFHTSSETSVVFAWLYALSYMLQIYFDFSGYSDMAIGLGKIFGFDLKENFDHPYESASVTEFWRRWHISLGSWFRDYIYIPLGGNRRGISRQLLNILIVWMLTGLWHGAAWNFVLWGLFYAVLLTVEKLVSGKFLSRHKVFGHIYLLLATLFGFVLFNASSLSGCVSDFASMLGMNGLPFCTAETLYYLRSYAAVIVIGIIGASSLPKTVYRRLEAGKTSGKALVIIEPLVILILLLTVTAYLVDGSFNPFLYFRF